MPLTSSASFSALTLIAAPGVLTNAASLLASQISTRFARSIDRSRSLATMLEKSAPETDPHFPKYIEQFQRAYRRTLLLLRALSFVYFSLGSLASSCVIALIGTTLKPLLGLGRFSHYAAIASIGLLALGVAGMALACVVLIRETRLAVVSIDVESTMLRSLYPQWFSDETLKSKPPTDLPIASKTASSRIMPPQN